MAQPVRKSPTVFRYRGKWRLTYVNAEGKEKSKTLASKQEAFEFFAAHSSHASPRGMSEHMPTLEQWLERWANTQWGTLRAKTKANYRLVVDRHIVPALGHLRLDELTPACVEDFYRGLFEHKGLAAASIQRVHSVLSAPLHGALRDGVISVNPMSLVVKPRAPKPRVHVLTAPQRQALWAAIHDLSAGEQLRWVLAVKFGLRQSEALGLTVNDIDPNQKVLSIRRQLQRIPYEGWVFTPPKSAQGVRDIPLDDLTVDTFIEAARGLPEGCELLFPKPDGSPRHASTDREAWLRLLEKAGIPQVSLHTARHTAATVMITSGVDVKTVQMVLGHSTPAFTLATYVHPSIEDLRRSLSRIF